MALVVAGPRRLSPLERDALIWLLMVLVTLMPFGLRSLRKL